MFSLFVDTHSSLITIALINEHEIIKSEKNSDKSHSIYVLPMINKILEENKLNLKNINKIIVINGPGSFTGIRIGLSIVKTIGYSLNIPVVTLSSLEAYYLSSDLENKLVVIEDSKGYYIKVNNTEKYVTNIDSYLKNYNKINNNLNLKLIYKYA